MPKNIPSHKPQATSHKPQATSHKPQATSHKISKVSETVTENLFRNYYGADTFIEKSAIPSQFGFQSKKKTNYKGYPDFLREDEDYIIIVEAKSLNQKDAVLEVQHYMVKNTITKDILGIAVSGQNSQSLKVDYFIKLTDKDSCTKIKTNNSFLSLSNIDKIFWKNKYGDSITSESLTTILKGLNKTFNTENKVRDTDRSLFFSGLMIALKDRTFRGTYKNIEAPSKEEVKAKTNTVLESYNLNDAILDAITRQLTNKINSLSKEYNWKDRFSFIKNIDYSLLEYKQIIEKIEKHIFKPFQNDEKQDILGKAYKIFLSRAGKIDNKNIILTPDHIKNLMVELARLNVDDVVIDTCAGTGGFLMEAMENMINKANNDNAIIERIKEKQLVGFEVDAVLFALACSNMFLHGDGRTNLLFRSSLLNDRSENIINNKDSELLSYIKSIKPTKCIINPPYENNNSIKFTKQALDYLEPNSKLVIIMPTPTLTQNQNEITKEILEIAKLDFVIKMPFKLFSEQKRTVNTSVFGFTKTPHNVNDDVLFYHLEDDGLVSIQHKGRVDKYKKWDGIKEDVLNCILNSKEKAGVCEKKKIFKDGILNCAGVQIASSKNSKMVKIDDLFNIEKGSLASENSEEGEYDFITGSEEWKTHSEYDYDKEAIIYVVSASGSLGRSHYVNGKFIASNLCLVLTPKSDTELPVNLQFYNIYFSFMRKKMVSDLADGTSKLTIRDDDLRNYYIDYIDIKYQNDFCKNKIKPFVEKQKKLKKEIEKSENIIASSLSKII